MTLVLFMYFTQGLGASEFFFYYIIQQGEELTCLHFFKCMLN